MIERKFDIEKFLPHVFLFSELEEGEISKVAQTCTLHRYKKGTLLFAQESAAEAFYVIINGKLSIYRVSPSGDERVIHIHDDGDVVAEAAIFDQVKYPANCKTLKDSFVVKIPRQEFIDILFENPETSLKIMAAYSRRLRELVTMIEYLSLDDVKLRILRYFQKHMKMEDGVPTIRLKISKKELSHLLGTVPETLSRNLGKLKKEGIISEAASSFIISNPKGFSRLLQS